LLLLPLPPEDVLVLPFVSIVGVEPTWVGATVGDGRGVGVGDGVAVGEGVGVGATVTVRISLSVTVSVGSLSATTLTAYVLAGVEVRMVSVILNLPFMSDITCA